MLKGDKTACYDLKLCTPKTVTQFNEDAAVDVNFSELNLSIVVGVVSGLLASFFAYTLVKLNHVLLVPWFESLVYKGMHVDGVWKQEVVYDEDDGEHDRDIFQLVLKQRAHEIVGSFTLTFIRAGKSSIGTYDVMGRIIDGYMQAILNGDSSSQSTQAVMLLKAFGNGRHLEGCIVYRNATTDEITKYELSLDKNPK